MNKRRKDIKGCRVRSAKTLGQKESGSTHGTASPEKGAQRVRGKVVQSQVREGARLWKAFKLYPCALGRQGRISNRAMIKQFTKLLNLIHTDTVSISRHNKTQKNYQTETVRRIEWWLRKVPTTKQGQNLKVEEVSDSQARRSRVD